jgi:hypothetical protein
MGGDRPFSIVPSASTIPQVSGTPRVSDNMTEDDFLRLTRVSIDTGGLPVTSLRLIENLYHHRFQRTQTIGTMAGFGSGAVLSKSLARLTDRLSTMQLTR